MDRPADRLPAPIPATKAEARQASPPAADPSTGLYLRISVTDRCDERCLYCRPPGYRGWGSRSKHLSAEEIARVARVAAEIGFRKFRLTGGEPLLRADLPEIVRRLAATPGVDGLGLSTNGTRLAALAAALRDAGLRSVNVSLDALEPRTYRRITGGNLGTALAGLRAALQAGFERVKLNCVLMRGLNEDQIWPLAVFAAEHGLPLRLIELMPVTTTAVLDAGRFLSMDEAMRILRQRDELIPQPETRLGCGPARYYRLKRTGALIGFVGAMTQPHFCDTCNKLRLTANGRLRPCLGDQGELDLRAALCQPASDEPVRRLLLEALRRKPLRHQFRGAFQPGRPMTAIGG
jgi:GTP 3',8-cyclase